MFQYWQGYEIDGSDTSYNLLMPQKEQCLEVLCYYLQLKTIDKNQALQIRLFKKSGQYSLKSKKEHVTIGALNNNGDFIYKHNESEQTINQNIKDRLQLLKELLQDENIISATIYYSYMPMNYLYTDIKKEIIQTVLAFDKRKTQYNQLKNPVFFDGEAIEECIYILLDSKKAEDLYNSTEDVSKEEYIQQILKNDYYAIEINCRLGALFGSIAYNLQKLNESFPELQIDLKNSTKDIYEEYLLGGKKIYERLVITSQNYADTIKRLIQTGDFHLQVQDGYKYKYITEQISLFNLPNLKDWQENFALSNYDERGYAITTDEKQRRATLKILKGLTDGKRLFTIDEYIEFAEKIAKTEFFTNRDVVFYTTFKVMFKKSAKENFIAKIAFERQKDKRVMLLDVPYDEYDYVCKKYSL